MPKLYVPMSVMLERHQAKLEAEARQDARAWLDVNVPREIERQFRFLAELYLLEDFLACTKYLPADLAETQEWIWKTLARVNEWAYEAEQLRLLERVWAKRGSPEFHSEPPDGSQAKPIINHREVVQEAIAREAKKKVKTKTKQKLIGRAAPAHAVPGHLFQRDDWHRARAKPSLSYYDNRRDPQQYDRLRFGIYRPQFE